MERRHAVGNLPDSTGLPLFRQQTPPSGSWHSLRDGPRNNPRLPPGDAVRQPRPSGVNADPDAKRLLFASGGIGSERELELEDPP